LPRQAAFPSTLFRVEPSLQGLHRLIEELSTIEIYLLAGEQAIEYGFVFHRFSRVSYHGW
jgi:hypothetical protein